MHDVPCAAGPSTNFPSDNQPWTGSAAVAHSNSDILWNLCHILPYCVVKLAFYRDVVHFLWSFYTSWFMSILIKEALYMSSELQHLLWGKKTITINVQGGMFYFSAFCPVLAQILLHLVNLQIVFIVWKCNYFFHIN